MADIGASRSQFKYLAIILAVIVLLAVANPVTVIPAGHVGIKDFFGMVSPNTLSPGLGIIVPFTRVVKMTVQTQEILEQADTPSREGLIINLEVSLLYRLDASKAAEIYKKVGRNYVQVVVEPQLRSAIREITASYDAKSLYSSERNKIAMEIQDMFVHLTKDRGIITDQVLLRKIGLPATVANAIQEKLKREQEAERKRIEAQGVADFQRIVAQGISPQLLEWKGIEATEKLANSPNTPPPPPPPPPTPPPTPPPAP
ncbi:MAG TPA: prohibitin family protein, partial [Deltaproteobacteria bacterium]|nr:prohibitin family protein [Deltaproteobacteria bacterium]